MLLLLWGWSTEGLYPCLTVLLLCSIRPISIVRWWDVESSICNEIFCRFAWHSNVCLFIWFLIARAVHWGQCCALLRSDFVTDQLTVFAGSMFDCTRTLQVMMPALHGWLWQDLTNRRNWNSPQCNGATDVLAEIHPSIKGNFLFQESTCPYFRFWV